MQELKERILKEGKVLPGNIVKVDGFLNHRIDCKLMADIADEFAKLFDLSKVDLILTAEAGVVIRRLSRKLSGAGIHHLEGGADVVLIAHGLYLILGKTCEPCDHVIREFDALCFL